MILPEFLGYPACNPVTLLIMPAWLLCMYK
jgi:hypothetical protein